jgi:simple sugar transport system permease protein/ribose transport system permease protein
VPILVMILIIGLAIFVLRATIFGRHVIAVGGNENAAWLSGFGQPHENNGLCFKRTARGNRRFDLHGASRRIGRVAVGQTIELDAIAATVVGGTALTGGRATVIGTVIGALIMQIITTSFI